MYIYVKRFFDIFFSLICILIFLPIFIIVSLILKFSGEGEVFYLQKRLGFKIKKFS
ncbi:MAG: galactosyl-1-phosphate transferase, partial [Gammaproteobacteria bacterium]|nr:galactosyl-1-phosphate transferase [Gammaproteobacteria bacterium]